MKFIGITGGVGAGKSTALAYLRENYRVRTLVADEIAHDIMEPGFDCYTKLQKEFARERIWQTNGRINRQRLADIIFADEEKRRRMNEIVHPAVKEYIIQEVEKERRIGSTEFVVLEAALLIEEGYDKICDEIWYVYVTEENRKKRLMKNRGYSEEKIEQIFASQLSDREYRRHCSVVLDNNDTPAQVYLQLVQLMNNEGKDQDDMAEEAKESEPQLVFGLDIGTRNVVGTVGYKKENEFIVTAQYSTEHETRAMLDGQIHDIGRVGRTIVHVKEKLEEQIGQELTEVCIAAAGRVLKTVTTDVEMEFPEETVVTREHIHTLDLLGVDKAYQTLNEKNDTNYKFYCVGYSVMKYYLNDEIFSNLESHKADKISERIIVTFLPEDVVDGLYMAVGFAGLTVANLTLEPIAAIDVAIPENFRMLNIALVDVGAGTSDISLTRDGSIIAYGMIPFAGDELTEAIVQHYLVDFKMAEQMKLASATQEEIEFEDIMSLKHTIPAQEIWDLTEPLVDHMSKEVAAKIRELNGDQTVSATFIVGGGGKIHGFDEKLAEELDLPKERVALRGEEVLKEVTFLQEEIRKDPLLVTPIGICLNYYEQKNNFIMVHFNGERIKLYDNNKLTVVDAAIQAGFPNEQLFPRRGREINFTVNGRPRIIRGDAGESAIVTMNGRPASINDPIEPNCTITIEPSTEGGKAHYTVGELDEYQGSTIVFEVNGKLITCPRYVEVNGVLEPPTYEIQENDAVVTRSFYTVQQLSEFMDVELDPDAEILVNNRVEDLQALVYENFTVDWTVLAFRSTPEDAYPDASPAQGRQPNLDEETPDAGSSETNTEETAASVPAEAEGAEKPVAAADTEEPALAAAADDAGKADIPAAVAAAGKADIPAAVAAAGKANISPAVSAEKTAGMAAARAEIQNTVFTSATGMEKADIPAAVSAAEKTGIASAEGAETPAFTSAAGAETPAFTSATGTERTAIPPAAGMRKTDIPSTVGTEGKEISVADDIGKADIPSAVSAERTALPAAVNFAAEDKTKAADIPTAPVSENKPAGADGDVAFDITVNGQPVTLKNKKEYVFVDVFDFYDFDLSQSQGRMIITQINGADAQYTQALSPGDKVEIYWKED